MSRLIYSRSIIGVLLVGFGVMCHANDTYIAQNAAGAKNGVDCADANSVGWFNSNAKGGNTYHLCGTFVGAAGSTMLTIPGGSSGNTLTVLFEPGATFAAPYWGGQSSGAIQVAGSYILIDGQTYGVIQNTANGDSMANHASSHGIYIQANSTNVEVRNLKIQNIYNSVAGGSGAYGATSQYTADICAEGSGGTLSNINIHDNTLNNAAQGVEIDWDGGTASNINIYNNLTNDHRFQIQIGSWVASGSTANLNVYGNTMTGWSNWTTTNDYWHLDGVIVWGDAGHPTNVSIYNNYIYGTPGGNGTAFIYCTWDGISTSGTASVCQIFNNVIVVGDTSQIKAVWMGSYTGPNQIYNNTIVGNTSSGANNIVSIDGTSEFYNNLFYNTALAVGSYATTCCTNIAFSDYDLYYDVGGSPFAYNIGGSGTFLNYSLWQTRGFDTHGVTQNPNLSGTYTLQSGSAAIGAGRNISSVCNGQPNPGLGALCYEKTGIARPSSGNWDIGAYQYATQSPASPTGLSAVVN